jgi:LytS/YehU family sensor histidine kinase
MIYLAILALVMLIRVILQAQFKKKLEDERHLANLKARSLKNLVDPHFTLNALNAISGMVSQKSPQLATAYITKFARMVHNLLSRSDELLTSLSQELDFVRDYLDLQQLRFPELFSYRIDVDGDVGLKRSIPKILIQTFAENAIRHGLRPKGKNGKLIITIRKEKQYLKVVVHDNGIGRQAALNNDTTNTGTGLKIVYQLIDILKHYASETIRFKTEDVTDKNGEVIGTRVETLLPEFNE